MSKNNPEEKISIDNSTLQKKSIRKKYIIL